jgi:hypothetical protein
MRRCSPKQTDPGKIVRALAAAANDSGTNPS